MGKTSLDPQPPLLAFLMTTSVQPKAMNPRKTARQGRSTATVDAIVEAAARILEAAGPSGYTTNAIAQRAGVSVGSLYQYFPNKDAITRALIRRELAILEAQIAAINIGSTNPSPLARLITVAVGQQLERPRLAHILEAEQERLGADADITPVYERVVVMICAILQSAGFAASCELAQDIASLIATVVNPAATRGDDDRARLEMRARAVVMARLSTP